MAATVAVAPAAAAAAAVDTIATAADTFADAFAVVESNRYIYKCNEQMNLQHNHLQSEYTLWKSNRCYCAVTDTFPDVISNEFEILWLPLDTVMFVAAR